ncbi:MAG: glycogen/starch/alpha-glucan phosphorylase, partial [Anaerococcus vaginalis]|nr:glycogen/starch/alpha-glucan phosphorylase [Anaerococcus vaginalis]
YPACDIYTNITHPLYDNQNFDILNSIFNMANIVSTRGGIVNNLKTKNEFYLLNDDYRVYKNRRNLRSYKANDIIYQNQVVKYTIDNLLKENQRNLPYDFSKLYNELLVYNDSFEIFLDLENLINLRKISGFDYLNKEAWAKNEVHNILWANEFNLDHIKRKLSFDK